MIQRLQHKIGSVVASYIRFVFRQEYINSVSKSVRRPSIICPSVRPSVTFLVNVSLDVATSDIADACHTGQRVVSKVKVKDQILFFLVNASPHKQLHVVILNIASA